MTSPDVLPLPDAAALARRVAALVAHFERVQFERMQGVALLNPALTVEAVGFVWAADEQHGAVAEGILITPWFMSLLRLPAEVALQSQPVGRKFVRCFGAESFEFIAADGEALGYHESCALFSPMNGFDSPALARETAEAALALARPAPLPVPASAEPLPARRAFFLARRPGISA
jgi:[NiFe] hydrogenase assembly HybE family chaperone